MDSEQELNRRRAEWAGINLTGVPMGCEPNFPQSLDAIFKLLVPKLRDIDIEFDFTFAEDTGGRMCEVTLEPFTGYRNTKVFYYDRDYNPALALCKAIDKLIDSEKKDE